MREELQWSRSTCCFISPERELALRLLHCWPSPSVAWVPCSSLILVCLWQMASVSGSVPLELSRLEYRGDK